METKILARTTVKHVTKEEFSTIAVQDKIQCYHEIILHRLGDNKYNSLGDKFNQFINENVPAPDENVYSTSGYHEHDGNN